MPAPPRFRFRSLIVAVLAMVVIAGCTTDDDDAPDATVTTAPELPTAAASPTSNTTSLVSGQGISDGICLAVIPDGWVDDGTGRGTISGGGRFVLFGGRVATDAAWQAAVDAVATPAAGRDVATVEESADHVFVTYGDNRGFEYRKRFGDRYCDLNVTGVRPFTDEEMAVWPSIIQTLEPVTR